MDKMDKKRVSETSLLYVESLLRRGEITFEEMQGKIIVFAAHNNLPVVEVEQFVATLIIKITNRVANTKIEFNPLPDERMREIAHIFALRYLRSELNLRRKIGDTSSKMGISTNMGVEYFSAILPELV